MMRLLSMLYNDQEQLGIEDKNSSQILVLEKAFQHFHPGTECPADMITAIHLGEPFLNSAEKVLEQALTIPHAEFWISANEIEWLAPITKPPKNIMCVGKNYAAHARELGSDADIPEYPIIFTKPHTSIAAHEQHVDLHREVSEQVDYEGEVAIVIGKKGSKIKREEAWDYVYGVTLLNDLTARDLQARHKQFFLGKSLDQFSPLGPVLVTNVNEMITAEETITTKVNGDIRQSAPLTDMIFDIPELIHIISRGITLEPGDIIATGTPAGVGKGMNPPQYLRAGDEVSIHLPLIGTLVNQMK
ncbi:2-keto-4-pentenoate hydratase/2-oxohepta-3-ene-1,7-dioic acid hydratase in catechol pathway [Geomicrobium halophilum]|uniref:2-keto-4-pentenoate hydratase/2-oxohepta-3-ene-1,7-dioic acid hydratase in catechol pathway n=1 Tax=Geomicrobium halophilum TaxID=549000 RepID=A0A841PHS2_9BACL|nr:fumarylacetoacetate hydrolase family protein [Geomicrobium halophilum]MBB6448437.1 2-keto-4-pentenoate hydratase/2-oxohepta-3-ene-1,7-dioic acid hydratase in catechol pathway [Geomicrobium halophilum]